MTGDPIDRTLVQPAAEDARDERSHRLLYLAGALVVVGVLSLAMWAWFSIRALHDEVTAATVHADTATSSAQQLYNQVRQLGGTPVVQPPVQGATGPAGAVGPVGPQGLKGDKGDKGDPGTPGESPQCLADPAHCQGAAGAQGLAGAKGDPGVKGDKGDPGQDGQNGQDGKNGDDGVSVTRQYFDRDANGQCRNFNDFSDGRMRIDEGPAGDAACAPATPPPTQTTPAILPPGVTKRRRD